LLYSSATLSLRHGNFASLSSSIIFSNEHAGECDITKTHHTNISAQPVSLRNLNSFDHLLTRNWLISTTNQLLPLLFHAGIFGYMLASYYAKIERHSSFMKNIDQPFNKEHDDYLSSA
jgi:hypothetical protein